MAEEPIAAIHSDVGGNSDVSGTDRLLEEMPKLIAEAADNKWQSRTISNALTTMRSTLRLAHLFVNTSGLRKNEFIRF